MSGEKEGRRIHPPIEIRLKSRGPAPIPVKKGTLVILVAALALAAVLSPLASAKPDGLERVAEDKGFLERAGSSLTSPLPDYLMPGVRNQALATSLAAASGTVLTFLLASGVARLLRKRGSQGNDRVR